MFYITSYEALCKTFAISIADVLFLTKKQLSDNDLHKQFFQLHYICETVLHQSRDNSVQVLGSLRAGCPWNRDGIFRRLFHFKNVENGSGPHSGSFPILSLFLSPEIRRTGPKAGHSPDPVPNLRMTQNLIAIFPHVSKVCAGAAVFLYLLFVLSPRAHPKFET